ncbi:methyltransferase domain-containing protein [Ghiorsea bivora]|uniref:methyltransferase domain-containing protein n=1 Tax=Ghiorsea bivora TaxID=1485545 RepID=UPI00056F4994|nr:methyltransferase domain-containing protein [Ghiorsea bivora]
MSADTNFDDLTEHFQKKIYGSQKGKIRLAVLNRDLEQVVPRWGKSGLSVLDLGAGLGQMGVQLAAQGHQVCMNDISERMLAVARAQAEQMNVADQIEWQHGAFQDLDNRAYDVVLCHAVLEWLSHPEILMKKLAELTQQHSFVSLMFYNLDALVFHNLIRGNFNKIKNKEFSGMKGGLTPPNPVKPAWVRSKLAEHGFTVVQQSGIRVFSDYVGIKRGGNTSDADVLAMELAYSQVEPYIHMGRYIHFVCQKS